MGGMGFRDLKIFNQALLAKQAWRLCKEENSLLHSIFKARYLKNSTFLEASRGYDPSFTWRSIWGAKSLLLEGLKWRVGNGLQINVCNDSWLSGDGAYVVPTPRSDSNMEMKVSELINYEDGCWDRNVVDATFGVEDRALMWDVPLSNMWPLDSLYWWPCRSGIFSVRTAYWLGRLGRIRAWELQVGGGENNLWRRVWSIKGPPKLLHFIWRVCKGSLGVRERLHHRHIAADAWCPICLNKEETIIHSLSECKFSTEIWTSSDFGELLSQAPTTSFIDRFEWVAAQLDKESMSTFLALVWAGWYCRNLAVFEAGPSDVLHISVGFVRLVHDYGKYANEVFNNGVVGVVNSPSSWSPPQANFVKVNFDAHIYEGGGVTPR